MEPTSRRRLLRCRALLLAVSLPAALAAQAPVRIGSVEAYLHAAGPFDHAGQVPAVVAEHVVRRPGAPFLGLELRDVVLPPGSILTVESLRDGDSQEFDAATWRSHGPFTAWFNGDAVRVRLIAAPGSRGNGFGIASIAFGTGGSAGPLSVCGTDDRYQSYESRVCRLVIREGTSLYVGTAFLVEYMGGVLTAGHNLSGSGLSSVTAQFNVPKSDASGAIVHPPARDQYDWDSATVRFQHDATGDWGLLRFKVNSTTALYAGEAQYNIYDIESPPALQTNLTVPGHGADTTPDKTFNHVQQNSSGPLVGVTGHQLEHRVDTEGGNSGSPLVNAAGRAFGVHTNGGCDATSTSFNIGWSVNHPGFASARNTVLPLKPNLMPRSIAASASAIQGGTAGVTVRIANLGRSTAGAYDAGVYLSTDDQITTGDRLLLPVPRPTQPAGQSSTINTAVPIPQDVTPGNYWIGVLADHQNAIDETFENDNAVAKAIRIDLGKADLVGNLFDVNFPNTSNPGVEVEVEVNTASIGDIGAPATRTGVVLEYNAVEHYVMGIVDVPAMAPNSTPHKVKLKCRIPWAAMGVASATVKAVADLDGIVGEKYESNNSGTFRLNRTINEYSAAGRDLVFRPVYPVVSERHASISTKEGGTLLFSVLSQDLADANYVMVWSANPGLFQYDAFSDFSLTNINTPTFWYWWSSTNRRWGARAAELRVPKLPSPLAFTVHTHALFFDQSMAFRGVGAGSVQTTFTAQ